MYVSVPSQASKIANELYFIYPGAWISHCMNIMYSHRFQQNIKYLQVIHDSVLTMQNWSLTFRYQMTAYSLFPAYMIRVYTRRPPGAGQRGGPATPVVYEGGGKGRREAGACRGRGRPPQSGAPPLPAGSNHTPVAGPDLIIYLTR